ncbi:hydroxysqualene dehydroxylase [Paenibacillus campi]|uniref:hydroxysqualene dehydroxylase n=1 Tax=Paenibacillus campi TaxID=3106031 RepID=UPI002AFE6867|nr:FAD-dependent oxidoreductase [Paenibacillus sp. SGZ-1014]
MSDISQQSEFTAQVIVVGAGLAGLSCAFELAEKGIAVTVLEAAPHVGGRTANWNEDGMAVESGFHKFIGYYVALPELLERAGIEVDKIVHWEKTAQICHPEAQGIFGLDPLKAPLKTIAGALGNNHLLSPMDKASLIPFFTAGFKDYIAHPDKLDRIPIRDYAFEHGVTIDALERLIEPLSSGIFFLPVEQYSSYAFFGLFAPALPRPQLVRIGAFEGGMTDVMTAPLARAIEQRGGQVLTNAPVEQLSVQDGRVNGVQLQDGTVLQAEHTIVAVDIGQAKRLVGQHFGEHEGLADLMKLESMPYVTVQFEAEEKLAHADHTLFGPGTQLGSFSEQSRTTFKRDSGRASLILVNPDELIDLPDEEVWKRALTSLQQIGLSGANTMTNYRVIRKRNSFYRLSAGNEKHRPRQMTPIPGLLLAGDYTNQPLLATMEGAVISGQRAARALLKAQQETVR